MALDAHGVPGMVRRGNGALVDPAEIGAVEVAVAHLNLHTRSGRLRNRFRRPHLPQDLGAVVEAQLHDVLRPEEAEGARRDENKQRGDHQQTGDQSAAGEPDERISRLEESSELHNI